MAHAYPFTAIVGQAEMKEALLLAAIEPRLGGVLIIGDRGTGKSTAVRALADALPRITVQPACRYNCDPAAPHPGCPLDCAGRDVPGEAVTGADGQAEEVPVPVIDLPLGATEDRVVGALDLEKALTQGTKSFEPGLLARAHRGFLYIDEVNLLEDHLVDLLLDVAVSGENIVEREGVSVRHPARFVLVGSGNPEEGELRPQLLDRFGLCVDVRTPSAVSERMEVIRRRDAFEMDPAAFVASYADETDALRERVTTARAQCTHVRVPEAALETAVHLCVALGTDGLRGELTLVRAARARAAYHGRGAVETGDVTAVAPAALSHRLRRDPLDESGSRVRVERAIAQLDAMVDAPDASGDAPGDPAAGVAATAAA